MGTEKVRTSGRVALSPALPVAAPDDERWQLVLRIIQSRQFSKSRQLRDILLYIAQRSLSGPDVTIKEHEIGCEVLGRGPDFDPHDDNIVRVQVGQLRKRLDEYFAADGQSEMLRLVVPKGSYVPHFESAAPAVADITPAQEEERPEETVALVENPPEEARWRYRQVLFWGMLIIVCGACFLAGRSSASGGTRRETGNEGRNPILESATDRLWSQIFGGAQPANIVVSDTCLVMLQDTLDTDLALSDYLNGQYPNNVLSRAEPPALRKALNLLAARQYTSLADLNSATNLMQLGHKYAATPAQVRYARHLNIREFKTGNFILLGSRRGIPWVELFEPSMGFAMEEDGATRNYFFRNKHPRAGEAVAWHQKLEGGNIVETYADLAVVPNLGKSGYVMLLAGLTMQATEAAGELVSRPEFARILSSLDASEGSPPRYFEILMRTRVIGGVARDAEVVASRVLRTDSSSN